MLQLHNLGTVTEPSAGERVALRRNRLGWKQRTLAEAAGVSLTTVVQIEKDRGVRTESLRAVLSALEQAEKGPTLSPPPGTTDLSTKEGVDAAHTRQRLRLETLEVVLVEALETVRRGLAEYDQGRNTTRKSG